MDFARNSHRNCSSRSDVVVASQVLSYLLHRHREPRLPASLALQLLLNELLAVDSRCDRIQSFLGVTVPSTTSSAGQRPGGV